MDIATGVLPIVRFLFNCDQLLSIIFIMAMVALFVYGRLLLNRCRDFLSAFRDNAAAEYADVRHKFTPHQFAAKKLVTISEHENVLVALPNIFVTVGILATFIGLGLAINDAVGILDIGKDVADTATAGIADASIPKKLAAMLNVIGIKFQTSVWGIIFSLAFQQLVNSYYRRRAEFVVAVENELYATYEAGLETLLMRQNDLISKFLTEFEQRDDLTTKRSDERHAALLATLAAHAAQESRLHKELLDEFERQREAVGGTLAMVAESAANFDRSAAALVRITGDYQEMCLDTEYQWKKGIETMQRTFVNGENNYVEQTQKKFSEILRDNLTNIHNEYIKASQSLNAATRTLDGTVTDFKTVLSSIKGQVEAAHVQIAATEQGFSKMQKTFSETTGDAFVEFNKAVTAMNEMVAASSGSRAAVGESIKSAAARQSDIAMSLTEIAASQKEIGSTLSSFSEKQNAIVKELRDRQDVLAKALDDIVGVLNAMQLRDSATPKFADFAKAYLLGGKGGGKS